MKTRSALIISILLIASAFTLQAQNALPDPTNDACWQSLDSLRACQLEQYNREMDYAQRCTSYPEYQCNPSTTDATADSELGKVTPKKTNLDLNAKQVSRVTNLTQTSSPVQTSDSK